MARVQKPLGIGARPWSIGSILGVLLGIAAIVAPLGEAVGTLGVVLVIFGVICLLLAVGTYLGDAPEPEAG